MNKQSVLGVFVSILLALNLGLTTYSAFLAETVTVNQAALAQSNYAVASELSSLTEYLKYLSGELLTETSAEARGEFTLKIHLTAVHRRDGLIIGFSEHAGTLTTIGKNWIEDQLGDSPAADPAKWISLSNNAGAPSAAWTIIPEEIAANGLTRAAGAYTSTGDGVWTITHTFTASGAQSVQLAGLNWVSTGDGNLLCADQISPASLIANDTLELTWTITVT